MTKAIDMIKELYVTEAELADLLNVNLDRIRDLRSGHLTGRKKFIDHIKPTSKSVLYPIENVIEYLKNSTFYSFGSTI